jgi:hypothetical protein
MESMAAVPGFARAIAGTGPASAAFLVPHILAGLTAIRVPAAAGGGCSRIPAQLRVPSPYGALADLGQPVQPSEVTQHAER